MTCGEQIDYLAESIEGLIKSQIDYQNNPDYIDNVYQQRANLKEALYIIFGVDKPK